MAGVHDQRRPPTGIEEAATPESRIDGARVAELFALHGQELRRFLLGVVRDPGLADDAMQAAFLTAIERGHTARPESLKGWLFQVAFREALAIRRRQGVDDRASRKLADLGPASTPEPDAPLIRDETVAAVRAGLARLPIEQRRVVLARIVEDRTFAQIAAESGLPLGTVLTRMRLALNALRKTLRPGD